MDGHPSQTLGKGTGRNRPWASVKPGNWPWEFKKPRLETQAPFGVPAKNAEMNIGGPAKNGGEAPLFVLPHEIRKGDDPPPSPKWLWLKNRYPKWNPGKWKLGLKPAGPHSGCHFFFLEGPLESWFSSWFPLKKPQKSRHRHTKTGKKPCSQMDPIRPGGARCCPASPAPPPGGGGGEGGEVTAY